MKKNIIKDCIIKAAQELFGKNGFYKTSVDEIAQAIEKGKSSIYYYFKSKEDIFRSVIEIEKQMFQDTIKEILAESSTPIEKIKNFIKIRMLKSENFKNLAYSIKEVYFNKLCFVKDLIENYNHFEYEHFCSILLQGCRTEHLQVHNVELAAKGIITAMRGIEAAIFTEEEKFEKESSTDSLINIVLFGIIRR